MSKKARSIKTDISILFILLVIPAVTVIGYIIFSNWKASAERMINRMQNEEHIEISSKIEEFTHIPWTINELNHHILENQIVNIYAEKERNAYFAGVMKAAESNVYSFSYGTEQGEYYGARRNQKNEIELMKNDASTKETSQYYAVTTSLTAGRETENFGHFDPRTRDWYIAAKEAKKPVFSSVYRHFVMNDLALSASYPIYDRQGVLKGVLGTHLTLSRINNYLRESTADKNTIAYIVEEPSGDLIANSLGEPNFLTNAESTMIRITIDDIDNPYLKEAYHSYKNMAEKDSIIKTGQDRLYIKLTEFKKDGLDWLIITAIPESPYHSEIMNSIYYSLMFSLFALILILFFWVKKVNGFLNPIYSLIHTTDEFSQGDFSKRATVFRDDEIGKLAHAFNRMAEELYKLVNNLEEKVKNRTWQLELLNHELIVAKESAEQAKDQLEQMVQTDFLTGLNNRRFLFEKLEEETKKFPENQKKFSIVLADIDYFKHVNDTYGHDCGDLVLKEVAIILQHTVRKTDYVSRWGGEEFLLLLPETEAEAALNLAERIRQTIEKTEFLYDNISLTVTVTLGIAEYSEGKTIDEIIKSADMAVYKGKEGGRNRVEYGSV